MEIFDILSKMCYIEKKYWKNRKFEGELFDKLLPNILQKEKMKSDEPFELKTDMWKRTAFHLKMK